VHRPGDGPVVVADALLEQIPGWTVLRSMSPGRVTLRPVLARSLPIIGSLDGCPN
jgi:hypothetical protein